MAFIFNTYRCHGTFQLKALGEGGYGCIYEAKNIKTEAIEAVKVEKSRARRPLLKMETLILKRMQGEEKYCILN